MMLLAATGHESCPPSGSDRVERGIRTLLTPAFYHRPASAGRFCFSKRVLIRQQQRKAAQAQGEQTLDRLYSGIVCAIKISERANILPHHRPRSSGALRVGTTLFMWPLVTLAA